MTGFGQTLGARRERLCLVLAVVAILAGASDWGAAVHTPALALVILGLTLAAYVLTRLRDAEHAANRLCEDQRRQGLTEALDAIASRIGTGAMPDPGTLEKDLARAIEQDRLDMVFQPIVDVADGRLIGAEALLRWEHPTIGPVPPARFMPIVEAGGLSDSYGLWVLGAACRAARQWQDAGLGTITVAVNLSAPQLHDPTLGLKVRRALDRYRLAPQALALELSAAAAAADLARTQALFAELRAIGIGLTIDECRAESSLIAALPVDTLKIDRALVGAGDRASCAALVALGAARSLRVIAPGVETADQAAALVALGCTRQQGYLFSRPLPGEAFVALARDPAWRAALRRGTPPGGRVSA